MAPTMPKPMNFASAYEPISFSMVLWDCDQRALTVTHRFILPKHKCIKRAIGDEPSAELGRSSFRVRKGDASRTDSLRTPHGRTLINALAEAGFPFLVPRDPGSPSRGRESAVTVVPPRAAPLAPAWGLFVYCFGQRAPALLPSMWTVENTHAA